VWTSGRYGGGLTFDGSNDYVAIGDVEQADGLDAVTVSTWVRFAVSGGGASETHFVDKSQCNGYPNGGPWELGVSLFTPHKAEFVIYPQGGAPSSFLTSGSGTRSLDDGTWHYVTGRYDGSNISVWVDGNLESSRSAPGLTMANTSNSIELGGHCNGFYSYPFNGTLDDVRIYDRALTASEILADMSTPVSTTSPPPSSPPPSSPPDTSAPSTPSGLTSSTTSSQVTLSWRVSTDDTGVAGYRVYRDGVPAGTSPSTSYTSTGLTANTTYAYTVSAFDAAGNSSGQSPELWVTTSSAAATSAPAPAAAYHFDAGSGTALADSSGSGHTGTLVNGPTWTTGKYNGGLAFDGSNDYVSVGDVAQMDGLSAITVSTWVKFAANGGGASETHLIDKSQCNGVPNGGPWELGVSLFRSHKAEFVVYPRNGSPSAYIASGSSGTSVDDGTWHFVTGLYDGSSLSIWVDGNLENSRSAAGLTLASTQFGIEFGGRCNGYYQYPFRGTLDDVRIYGRALTPSEIAADMATPVGNGATTPPLAADSTAPSTPTGLTFSTVTASQVTLSWQPSTDNVGVSGYRLFRDGGQIATTSATSITNSGLSANRTYVYAVAAYDSAGNESAQSSSQSVTTAASSSGAGYSTTFTSAENPISDGGRWRNGKAQGGYWNDVQTVPGKAYGAQVVNGYDDDIAVLTTSFNPNQYAQATVTRASAYSPGVAHEVELLLRFQITNGNARGYEVLWGQQGYLNIIRWNGSLGDFTGIVSIEGWQIGPAVEGDVLRAEVVGDTISVYRNGSLVASARDSRWTDGQPGMGFWPTPGSTPQNYGWKYYEAGSL